MPVGADLRYYRANYLPVIDTGQIRANMNRTPPPRLSASEFVAETLRREILRGELAPLQPLLQDHIATRFDVSQSSVREALRRLESLALVVSIRNRGTFVARLTTGQVEEMYEIRLALELIALRHNFNDLSSTTLAEAEALLNEMEKDPETAFFLGETHKQFHAAFYDSADRKLGRDVLQNIYGNLTRLWVDFIRKKPSLARHYEEQSRQQHRDLLRAAQSRDLAKAEAVLIEHVTHARELLVSHLRQVDTEQAPEREAAASSPTSARVAGHRGAGIK
jgi:DNA-binding GntR family transcriptional regulator